MTTSDRLKAARTALCLKQSEIAAQSGVSERAYQGYEAGRSVPGGEAIEGFVRLGINANWLLTGEGEMLDARLNKQYRMVPTAVEYIAKESDSAAMLLDQQTDDRLRMLQMVLRMSEMQLKDPPPPDVAKKVIDLANAWSPFAAKFPDLKERLDTLKATASFFI